MIRQAIELSKLEEEVRIKKVETLEKEQLKTAELASIAVAAKLNNAAVQQTKELADHNAAVQKAKELAERNAAAQKAKELAEHNATVQKTKELAEVKVQQETPKQLTKVKMTDEQLRQQALEQQKVEDIIRMKNQKKPQETQQTTLDLP